MHRVNGIIRQVKEFLATNYSFDRADLEILGLFGGEFYNPLSPEELFGVVKRSLLIYGTEHKPAETRRYDA